MAFVWSATAWSAKTAGPPKAGEPTPAPAWSSSGPPRQGASRRLCIWRRVTGQTDDMRALFPFF
jgi:hypothetical protein